MPYLNVAPMFWKQLSATVPGLVKFVKGVPTVSWTEAVKKKAAPAELNYYFIVYAKLFRRKQNRDGHKEAPYLRVHQ